MEKRYRDKECQMCGSAFEPNSSNQRYCCDECSRKARNAAQIRYMQRILAAEEKIDRKIAAGQKRHFVRQTNGNLAEIARRAAAEGLTYGQYCQKHGL